MKVHAGSRAALALLSFAEILKVSSVSQWRSSGLWGLQRRLAFTMSSISTGLGKKSSGVKAMEMLTCANG